MYYKDGKPLDTIFLTEKQWDQRIKNIFNRNIKRDHISGDLSSIERDLHDCVIEREYGTGDVIIAKEQYKELYKTVGVRKETIQK